MQAMIALPAWQEWRRAALKETWVIQKFEYDWPTREALAGGCRMKLVIGNKNYSSWSLRPWIAMKALGIPFEEILIPFGSPIGNPDFKAKLAPYTPAGRVPVLVDGDTHVWETLAILEYLAEKFPEKQLWPADAQARARGACARERDACGLFGAARRMPDEHPPAREGAHARAGRAGRRRAHRGDVERLPRAPWRTFPVRQILRRGRHVCAGGHAPAHLRHRGRAARRAATWRS